MRVKVNGTELEVNQYPNQGEAIVFIHFSGGNLAQWQGVIPYFIPHYSIVTLDLRGHGRSEKPRQGYTLDNLALDVLAVMNHLKIQKAHLVGSSLGGEIAVNLAARFPERILSVVAEGAIQNYFGKNGVFDIPEEAIPRKKIELRKKRAEREIPVYESIVERIEAMKKAYEQGSILWNPLLEEFERYNTLVTPEGKYTAACPKWVIDQYIEDFWDIQFERYFERITCPMLMLPSEEEWNTP